MRCLPEQQYNYSCNAVCLEKRWFRYCLVTKCLCIFIFKGELSVWTVEMWKQETDIKGLIVSYVILCLYFTFDKTLKSVRFDLFLRLLLLHLLLLGLVNIVSDFLHLFLVLHDFLLNSEPFLLVLFCDYHDFVP